MENKLDFIPSTTLCETSSHVDMWLLRVCVCMFVCVHNSLCACCVCVHVCVCTIEGVCNMYGLQKKGLPDSNFYLQTEQRRSGSRDKTSFPTLGRQGDPFFMSKMSFPPFSDLINIFLRVYFKWNFYIIFFKGFIFNIIQYT